MSNLKYVKLSASEIEGELKKHPEWALGNGGGEEGIERTFEFKEYQMGLVFASHVGYLADQLNHHPDMVVGYKKVRVSLSTHDVRGISPYDFELAGRIDSSMG